MKLDAPFHLDFVLERKAEISIDDGETVIEGYASDFGLDRQNEAFESDAFTKGMDNFMRNPVIVYHHKLDEPLGRVEEFENRKDGLWVKARLDAPEPGTKAADHVRKVRSGTIKGFSVGGKFHRRKGPDGRPRIHTADILEISLTPAPVNPRTLFDVVGKAFPDDAPDNDSELKALAERLDKIAEVFKDAEQVIGAKAVTAAVSKVETDIKAFPEASDKDAAKVSIVERATQLKRPDLLPKGWA